MRLGEAVTAVSRRGKLDFEVVTEKQSYRARRVIVAMGKSGTPRKLDVPGEDSDKVHYRLYNPKTYSGKTVLVVGGGNSAIEAAVALAAHSRVTLSYRGSSFYRVSKANERKLNEAVATGNLEVWLMSNGKWAASVSIGNHPAGWSPAGIGDFDRNVVSEETLVPPTPEYFDMPLLPYEVENDRSSRRRRRVPAGRA